MTTRHRPGGVYSTKLCSYVFEFFFLLSPGSGDRWHSTLDVDLSNAFYFSSSAELGRDPLPLDAMPLIRRKQMRVLVQQDLSGIASARDDVLDVENADPPEPGIGGVVVGVTMLLMPQPPCATLLNATTYIHAPDETFLVVQIQIRRFVWATRRDFDLACQKPTFVRASREQSW